MFKCKYRLTQYCQLYSKKCSDINCDHKNSCSLCLNLKKGKHSLTCMECRGDYAEKK